MEKRVNRSAIFANVANKTGFAISDIKSIYEAIISEIISTAMTGRTVVLNGFGTFYVQSHKGHPIQFKAVKRTDAIEDYLVFKFSASHSMNDRLRKLSLKSGS